MAAFVEGWTQVRVLGEGTYGEVRLLLSSKGEPLAVKIINLEAARARNEAEAIMREVKILSVVSAHANIVKYYSHRFTDDTAYIFLEYCDGGELFDQIEPDEGMPSERAQRYFRQMIEGVQHIHSRGIVHRDIKPENLLLTQSDQLKISDFGLATVYAVPGKGERLCLSRCGTLPYVAPEVISGRQYRGPPADVWSCGVVLVAMLCGQLPWDRPSADCAAYVSWTNKTYNALPPWSRIGTGVMGLLCSVLKPAANERATTQSIQQNPWYNADLTRQRAQFTRVHSVDASGQSAAHLSRKRKLDDGASATQPLATANSFLNHRISADDSCCGASSSENLDSTAAVADSSTCSFTQPANLDSLMLSESITQSQLTQCSDPLLKFVRRMTRFIVNVDAAAINKQIQAVCLRQGKTVKSVSANQLLISSTDRRKEPLKYSVGLFDMGHGRVLVDCRRSMASFVLSSGDGLEFKREFKCLKKELSAYVCLDAGLCLRDNGYVISANITQQLNQLSTLSQKQLELCA